MIAIIRSSYIGYIDFGNKRLWVTWPWLQFMGVGDRISILVTSFGCWSIWCLCSKIENCDDGFGHCCTVFVSNIRHQHRCSPAFIVTQNHLFGVIFCLLVNASFWLIDFYRAWTVPNCLLVLLFSHKQNVL